MTPLLEALVLIILGLLSLLLGKRLFWLFAGIVGFALGWWLMGFINQEILRVIVGIIVGLILGGLARFLGKWAIRIIAAIAGFVILPMLLGNLHMLGGISEFVWAILGAILGLVFAMFLADWTLIFLSSILGAGLILNGVQAFLAAAQMGNVFSDAARTIVGFILIIVGVLVQSRQKP
ncbi:MAG TPA: hypothetical protein VMP08_16350 [Anaerolineae bacterium]|nr:hypothetical protein [Anaerolineae bacterium]